MAENILSIEDIENAVDTETKIIDVPEWGGAIKIKSITKGAQWKMAKASEDKMDASLFERLLLTNSIIEPEFTEETIEILYEKSAEVVNRVLASIYDISGLSGEVQAEIGEEFPEQS